MVSTGDSDIPSSCNMKDEPAFKSLQGNPALFQVKASWCPFHFSQKTLGLFHIPKAERSLLNLAYLLTGSQGISSHLDMIWGT